MATADNSARVRTQKLQARMAYSGYLIEQQAVREGRTNRMNSSGAPGSAIGEYSLGTVSFAPDELAGILQTNSSIPLIPPVPAGAPSSPRNVVGVPGNLSVALSWTAPLSQGDSPITSYTITASGGAGGTWTSTLTNVVATGLVNGTAYTFTVVATNTQGNSLPSAPSSPITPATLPGQPLNVTGVAGNTTVALSWNPPVSNGGAAITSYFVYTYISDIRLSSINIGSANTNYTVPNLVNETTYTFTVAAVNSVNTGLESLSSAPITPSSITVPSEPLNVTGVPGDSSVQVSWSAPTSDGGSPITSYYISSSPAGFIGIHTNLSSLTMLATELVNGTAYTFTVRARNQIGESIPSAPSPPITPVGVPDSPQNVTGVPGDSSVQVSWSAPATDGGSPITSYTISSSPSGFTGTQTNLSSLTILATGLVNGIAYRFRVTAQNQIGDSIPSAFSLPITPVTIPDPPQDVTGIPGNGSVQVFWNEPNLEGGTPVISYTVTSNPDAFVGTTNQVLSDLNLIATGLTNGTAYTFTVYATNLVGNSLNSAPSAPITPYTIPGQPVINTAIPGDSSVTLSWFAPIDNGGDAITDYIILPYIGNTQEKNVAVGSPITSYTVTGLINGTEYTFAIIAVNRAGAGLKSADSAPVTPSGGQATVPSPPTVVNAIPNGSQSAQVAWDVPVSDGGSPIISYTVTSSPGGITITIDAPSTTTPISGLIDGTAYTFTVVATNAIGSSVQSPSSLPITPGIPDKPTDVTAVRNGDGTLLVSWVAPSSTGGSPIVAYSIFGSPGGIEITIGGSFTSISISDITIGISYTFTVLATNVNGSSPQSEPSIPVSPATFPGPPILFSATPGDASVILDWISPDNNGGATVINYIVNVYIGGIRQNQINTGSAGISYVVLNLTNGTEYTFNIIAVNEIGQGAESNLSEPVSPIPGGSGVASPPLNVRAVPAGSGALLVSWDIPVFDAGLPILGYTATASPGGAQSSTTTETNALFSFLTNGTPYTFTVIAINSNGYSSPSQASSPVSPIATSVPDPPTNVTASNPSGKDIVVSWDTPVSNGGSPITMYNVFSNPSGLLEQRVSSPLSGDGIFLGLIYDSAYTFYVTATNANGTSALSEPSFPEIFIRPSPPSAPQNVSAIQRNLGFIVNWEAPLDNGGTPIQSYRLVYTGPDAPVNVLVDGTTFTYEITVPFNGQTYLVSLYATNTYTDGENSVPVTVTPNPTVSDPPTIDSVQPGPLSVFVTISPPIYDGGGSYLYYRVVDIANGVEGTGDSPVNVTNLDPTISYTFVATMVTSAGESLPSDPSSSVNPLNQGV